MSGVPDGWPCALLAASPPSVVDREAQPTPDDLLPQILALTPRGAAWGTDEVGDGRGASPVQLSVWRAVAAWVADHLGRDWTAATQALPSAVTYTLPDWEAELGLPDTCGAPGDAGGRARAVRSRFGALAGVSPDYFVCLAQSVGVSATVEEPTQFLCDVSSCVGPDIAEGWFVCGDGACDGSAPGEAFFLCDDGACDDTPIESFTPGQAGDGDPIESFLVGQPSDPGDQVAGLAPVETAFVCDDGACDDSPLEGFGLDDPNGSVWKDFVVHLPSGGDTAFTCDDGMCGDTPVDGFVDAPVLECLVRARTPQHVRVTFAYDA